jgi:hypothetical protein
LRSQGARVLVRSLFSSELPASLRWETFHVNVVLEHHLPVPSSLSLERVFMSRHASWGKPDGALGHMRQKQNGLSYTHHRGGDGGASSPN